MNQDDKERINSKFRANINRVSGLLQAFDSLGTPGAGRPSYQQVDVLRAAVVLLHATLEDLLPHDFVEDRLSRLVRSAVETEHISLSRGAEILRVDLRAMRSIANSWLN